jgi:methyl-accepting chemotaxis protein
MALVVTLVAWGLLARATDKLESNLRSEITSRGAAIALGVAAELDFTTPETLARGLAAIRAYYAALAPSGVAYLYVQDHEASILLHTFEPTFPPEFVETNWVGPEGLKPGELVRIAPAVDIVIGERRIEAIDIAAPIARGANGIVHVGMDREKIAAEIASLRSEMLRWGGGIALGGVLLGLLVVAFVVIRPIRRMTQVALRIAEGDLSPPELRVGARDEIGRMAQAFERMLHSLRELAAAADRIAAGNLTGTIGVDGQLAESFNRMIGAHKAVVRQISEASTQLAGAAVQLHAAAQQQEASAAQQSSGAEEVSRTMESLLESAAHIYESTRGVLSNAEQTLQTSDVTAKKIAELNGHTGRIGEILEVIREIADRSDLLALNASLEGTRAGEAGRAFSLVANEMRRLAERVTASVESIKSLVADVRASGSSTILSTEEARKLAENTTEAARRITLVTQQQRSGTEQVSESMRDISDVLAQSVRAAQQTRASAEHLKGQAEELAEVVSRFRLEERS